MYLKLHHGGVRATMIEVGKLQEHNISSHRILEAHLQQCATMTFWSKKECGTKQFKVRGYSATIRETKKNKKQIQEGIM